MVELKNKIENQVFDEERALYNLKDTDLAFEYSEVEADIKGNVVSIKNPKSGTITVDSVGEIINEDSIMEVEGKVLIREKGF